MKGVELKKKVEKVNSVFENGLASDFYSNASFKVPISKKEIVEFEEAHEITLPNDYSFFLSEIANGGLGLLSLNQSGEFDDIGRVWGVLKKSFMYKYEAKIMNLDQFISTYKNSPDFIKEYVDIREFREKYCEKYSSKLKLQLNLFEDFGVFEGEKFVEELHGEYFSSSNHFNGALIIDDYGCNHYGLLIVSGKFRGTVWGFDSNQHLFYPKWAKNGKRMEYFDLVNDTIDQFFNENKIRT